MLSILCVVTITEMGPIIFLRLSEKSSGSYDGTISSRGYGHKQQDFDSINNLGYYLSYTDAMKNFATLEDGGKEFQIAPRFNF